MKKLFLLALTAIILTSAHASWEPALKCDNDSFVIDKSYDYRFGKSQINQMVIKGQALEFLSSQGAIPKYEIVNDEAVISVTRNLKHNNHTYYSSVYMKPGTPSTIAWYDVQPFNGGMILRFNQPSTRVFAEYKFYACDYFLNP